MPTFCAPPTLISHSSRSKYLCSASAYPRGKAEHARRVFVGDSKLKTIGATINLPEAEIKHLRAARAKVGSSITLLNQSGDAAYGTLDAGRTSVTITTSFSNGDVNECETLSVAVCAPKSNSRADWMVEKAAELGATKMICIASSERMQTEGIGSKRLERWRRVAAAAAKQSLSRRVMTVKHADTLLGSVAEEMRAHSCTLLCSPRGSPMLGVIPRLNLSSVLILVGPEGGLTDEEEDLLIELGCVPTSLGNSRLRVETAVISATSVLASFQYARSNFRKRS